MLIYLLYKIAQALALTLPVNISYGAAEFLGDVKRVFSPRDKKDICANFRAILGQENPRIHKQIKEVYRNFAKYFVDFLRFPKIDHKFLSENVRIENIHYFDEALEKGKGAIVLSAHIGHWELAGAVTALLGYPLLAVALVHKNKRVNHFFRSQRENTGMEVIPFGGAFKRCYNGLQENKMLALLGDRDFTNRGVLTTFLGKNMRIPKGPAALSLATGAPIVPTFFLREKDDKFKFIVEKPVEYSPSGDAQDDILKLTGLYLRVIERYIKAYPEQWLLFRKFWEPPIW